MSAAKVCDNFAKKLDLLNNTQNSMQTLSHWAQFHADKAEHLMPVWLRKMQQAPVKRKVAFVYLANDILLSSKAFATALQPLLLDVIADVKQHCNAEQRGKVGRVIGIWKQQRAFPSGLLAELESRMAGNPSPPPAVAPAAVAPAAADTPQVTKNPLVAALQECDAEMVQDAIAAVSAASVLMADSAEDVDTAPLQVHVQRLEKKRERGVLLLKLLEQSLAQERTQLEECEQELEECRKTLENRKRKSPEPADETEEQIAKKARS